MNIRCAFCQTPYTLSRVEMLDALQEIDSKKLSHYDAHCPRCRRATQLPRQRLEIFMPNWRDELKVYEAEMKEHPQQEAPAPAPEAASAPAAEPKASQEKKPVEKPKPAEAKAAATSSPKAESAPKKVPATKKAATKKSK
jgi:hypothetical protein